MPESAPQTIKRLEQLAAWHRINAERAGAPWVWEARLRTAEALEREAAGLRATLSARNDRTFRSPPRRTRQPAA